MKTPYGYCDLRVERVNDQVIDALAEHGYSWIAVNTTVDCSLLGVGCSNKKKRKHAESDNEEEKEWVPIPKLTNKDNSKLNMMNRLTIQITNLGQLHRIMSSQNFRLYDILAVEPLNDKIMVDLTTSSHVDIIVCNMKTSLSRMDYIVAVEKNIHFEISYGPMLINSTLRQENITLAHLLHIKGKSKNVIVSSSVANKFDIRNPHDIINLGLLLGLSKQKSNESISKNCHSIILKSYGRKLGKSAIYIMPENNTAETKSKTTH